MKQTILFTGYFCRMFLRQTRRKSARRSTPVREGLGHQADRARLTLELTNAKKWRVSLSD